MDSTKNYYDVLGVLPTAEPIVIRAAYRALAMKYHPDKWTGDKATAERRMREINEAYEVLSNEQSRARYNSVRRKKEAEDYDVDNDATNDAFGDAEQEHRSDWQVAVDYYPDLETIYAELKRTSTKLAFAFRTTLIETKKFSNRKELAEQLETNFLQTYFGYNKQILEFARTVIAAGEKDAAKELNRAVSVFGAGADASVIIKHIRAKFFSRPQPAPPPPSQPPPPPPAPVHEAERKLAETLLRTSYVVDAIALVEKLGGTVRQEFNEIVVAVWGEVRRFEGEMSYGGNYMVRWVIETIVPRVLAYA